MPLVGFRCPVNGEEPGRTNEFDYCLTQCQKRCMPKAILAVSRDQNVHNVHKGDMITPSALKGCIRKLVLERTENYYEEPGKLYYAVRGSLIHGFLEGHGLPNVQTEKRLFKEIEIDGRRILISGQIDYYDGDEQTIEDYKTISDKGTYFLFEEGAKPEHILQTNVYRWLCNGGRLGSLDGPVVNWPVSAIKIHYLFMNRVVTTGSTCFEYHTTYKSPNYGKRYKLEKNRAVVRNSPRGVPVWEIALEIPAVPLLSDTQVLQHLEMAAVDVQMGFQAAERNSMPPGVLYEPKEAWQCGYCGVKDRCHAYERQTNYEKFETLNNANVE